MRTRPCFQTSMLLNIDNDALYCLGWVFGESETTPTGNVPTLVFRP